MFYSVLQRHAVAHECEHSKLRAEMPSRASATTYYYYYYCYYKQLTTPFDIPLHNQQR